MIIPQGDPAEAEDHPYTLLLEYEHEQSHDEMGEPECPKIEIHLVVEPAKLHTEALECSDEEIDLSKSQDFERTYNFNRDSYVKETSLVLPSSWI